MPVPVGAVSTSGFVVEGALIPVGICNYGSFFVGFVVFLFHSCMCLLSKSVLWARVSHAPPLMSKCLLVSLQPVECYFSPSGVRF